MKKILIGGVPEHFNLPWLDALAGSAGARRQFEWRPQPQGTGAMVAALERGALDAALLLTEGAVAGIAAGGDFDIVARYVATPLQWGIHVPGYSDIAADAIAGARYAVSRHGSGSHLMAVAHALRRGWSSAALEFVVVGTLEGARAAFREGRADVFFWERFMTEPLVRAAEFRRIGIFEAPWPAFVLCIAGRVEHAARSAVMQLYAAVLESAQAFKRADDSAARVAETFGIELAAAAQWLAETRWAEQIEVDSGALHKAAEVLREAGLIEAVPAF